MDKKDEIEYSIEIDELGVHLEKNGYRNVIYEIRAYVVGKISIKLIDGEMFNEERKKMFVLNIPTDNLDNFIEYDSITEDDVKSWINEYMPPNLIENFQKTIYESFYPTKKYLKPNF